jgi:hypothetical protein
LRNCSSTPASTRIAISWRAVSPSGGRPTRAWLEAGPEPASFLTAPGDQWHGIFRRTAILWRTHPVSQALLKSRFKRFHSLTGSGPCRPTAGTNLAGGLMVAKSTISPQTKSSWSCRLVQVFLWRCQADLSDTRRRVAERATHSLHSESRRPAFPHQYPDGRTATSHGHHGSSERSCGFRKVTRPTVIAPCACVEV